MLKMLVAVVAMASTAGCGNDDGRVDGGPTECAIDETYTSIHDNLLSQGGCASSSCHGSARDNNGQLDLSGGADAVYDILTMNTTFHPAAVQRFPRLVVANTSTASYLFEKLSQPTPTGGARMPFGGARPQCEIDAVETWINTGAPKN